MARVHHVKKARKASKPRNCESCGESIEAGQAYKHTSPGGFGARKRMRHEDCPNWRPSEVTTSDKLSRLYAAREAVEDVLEGWDCSGGDASEIREALEAASETAREVGGEYEESASNMDEHFPGSPQVDEINEKAEECETWASTLDDAASDIEDWEEDSDGSDEDEGCDPIDANGQTLNDWADDVRSKADDANGSLGL